MHCCIESDACKVKGMADFLSSLTTTVTDLAYVAVSEMVLSMI